MSKNALSQEDKSRIEEFSQRFEAGLDVLEKAKQLNIGDYLVLYLSDDINGKMRLQTNSYGAPIKYRVVHSTKHNIPFVKKVNKKGDPVGQLYSCVGHLETDDYRHATQKFQFELDPDYADSLLLQDGYDPSILHRSKREIWKDVTEHNKKNKVDTHVLGNIVNCFNDVKVGDMLWSSNASFFLIQDKKTLSRVDFNAKRSVGPTRVKGPFIMVLVVRDKNGMVKEITPDFFAYKALYKERPRSYKELNI
jgi:predicted nucleic acid-binding protein